MRNKIIICNKNYVTARIWDEIIRKCAEIRKVKDNLFFNFV